MSVKSYYRPSDKQYSETSIPQEDASKCPTLGKIITDLLGDRKGDVVHRSKTGSSNWQGEANILYSKESVAERLGITVDMLKKKLYHRDISRDWIIAICAAYGLNAKETSQSLNLYDHPSLDFCSKREDCIETYLDEHQGVPSSLAGLNNLLIANGFLPLQIQKRSSAERTGDSRKSSPFVQIGDIHLQTFGFEGDPYDSLETKFYPSHEVKAYMLIKGPEDVYFELSVSSNDDTSYRELEKEEGGFHYKRGGEIIAKQAAIDHPSFGQLFLKLFSTVNKEMRKYDDLLHDSRNYRGRFSANLKDCALHAFFEEYNYAIPERKEYYLMEYWKGNYTLSVAYESMFMREYLSEDDYFAHYNSRDRIKRKTYTSVDEIEELLNNTNDWYREIVLRNRKSTFVRLQKMLAEKVKDIQDRKIFIRNIDAIWDNPADVLRYYKIEDLFKCEYDPVCGEICSHLDRIVIGENPEDDVMVTFNDVRTGFEYGFDSFDQICEYKKTHNSVSEVLF